MIVSWLVLYGISTFVGYLMPNPFLFIYIVIHSRLLYHNISMWLDMRVASSLGRNQPNFTSGWWHTLRPSLWLSVNLWINAYVSKFICLHFVLSDTGMLTSLEELCFTWVATIIFLHQSAHSPPRRGECIYCHQQTVLLYHNSSVWLDIWVALSWGRNLPICNWIVSR